MLTPIYIGAQLLNIVGVAILFLLWWPLRRTPRPIDISSHASTGFHS